MLGSGTMGWRWGWEKILPCAAPSLLLASLLVAEPFSQAFRVAFVLFFFFVSKTCQGNAVLTCWPGLYSAHEGRRGNIQATKPRGHHTDEKHRTGFVQICPASSLHSWLETLADNPLLDLSYKDAVSLYGSHMEQRDLSQYTLSIKNKVYNGTVTTAAGSAVCQLCPHVGSWKLVCLVR